MTDKELDYLFAEKYWRVADFEGLAGWVKIIGDDMVEFHSVACRHPGWGIVRSKYGINPLDAENPDEVVSFRPRLTIPELARYSKMKAEDISPLLSSIEGLWFDYIATRPDKPKTEPKLARPGDAETELKTSEGLTTLLNFGFSGSIFDLAGRDPFERKSEVIWMAERVGELHRMFEEPMAKTLARQAILNEMFLRRCDDQMTKTPPRHKDFWAIQDTKLKIEAMYQKQWTQLETICPFIKAAVGRITVSGLFSEFIESVKMARHQRKLDLVDGLYDAYGIQVDLRTSHQDPVPKYRPSIVAMVAEARKGLWDPHWKCPLNTKDFRFMDLVFRTGYERLVEEGRIKQTDLEADGPEGEYPALSDDLPGLPPETIPLNETNITIRPGASATATEAATEAPGSVAVAERPHPVDTEAPQAV